MNPKADPAESSREALLRQIPSVDELLTRPQLAELIEPRRTRPGGGHRAIRAFGIALAPGSLRKPELPSAIDSATLESRVIAEVEKTLALSLRPLINATGVVLHTNLGRAPLSADAIAHLAVVTTQYSNLEYDLTNGARGKRDVHTSQLLAQLDRRRIGHRRQ